MVKYLSFYISSFALSYFLMYTARPQCDTPLVFVVINFQVSQWLEHELYTRRVENSSKSFHTPCQLATW